uniref:hypothetical protein n=1 Tax=Salmonella enterica TaxID=28901 RepID=UPI00155DB0CF|nr:hypothetical protein [Salmonella enterica]
MNMRGILFVLPLCAGLLAGCDNKQEALKFEAARMAALKADDPFLALDSFEQQSGDYGRDCDSLGAFLFGNFASTDKACRARDEATRDMVLKAVEKGSVPALVFLFDPGSKTPDVYPRDIDPQKAGQAAERLVALAESAPVDSKKSGVADACRRCTAGGPVRSAGFPESGDPVRQSLAGGRSACRGRAGQRLSFSQGQPAYLLLGGTEQRRAAAGQSGPSDRG